MNPRLLIIGNTSQIFQIGSIFARAAKEINLPLAVIDINQNNYAPSMKYLWGKAFFKLAGKRPLEWWQFHTQLITLIKDFQPKIILVTGIFSLTNEVFSIASEVGSYIVNYLTDDPWNPSHYSSKFINTLNKYDLILSTKTKLFSDLAKHKVKQYKFLPFAYDPYIHHQPIEISNLDKSLFEADICFIGTGDTERLPYLNAIAYLNKLNLKIYGGQWDNISVKQWQKHPQVVDDEYRLAIYSSKLSLGILRQRNRDESTLRTFEIAACGGCGIYEDTSEHREILVGYPEYGFFSSPEDLADKCNWLLKHPVELEQMRQLGIELIVKDSNTYTARLKKILEWLKL